MEIYYPYVTKGQCHFMTLYSFIRADCLINMTVLPAYTTYKHIPLSLSELVQMPLNTTLHYAAQTCPFNKSSNNTQCKANSTTLVSKFTKRFWQKPSSKTQNMLSIVIVRNQLYASCIPKAPPKVQKKFVTSTSVTVNKALCCYQ